MSVREGYIQVYGSSVIPNPNSALNDFNLSLNSTLNSTICVSVSTDGSAASGSQTSLPHESIFVFIEGVDPMNDYTLVVSTSKPPDNNERGSGEPDVSYPTEGEFAKLHSHSCKI